MSADPYSAAVRRLFAHPDHAGRLEGGIEALAEGQGVHLRLMASVRDGRILRMRFEAWGCPHLLAACEAACADVEGRPAAELEGYDISALIKELSIPVEKTGRILVLDDAIRSLASAAGLGAGPESPGSGA